MTIWNLPNNSIVKVHDIFEPLPEFMKQADCIFTNLPYNLDLLNSFYTKANRTDYKDNFECFYMRLFECIDEIKPNLLFLEIGKEYLANLIIECKKRYKQVTFYNNTYSRRKENRCYIVQASNKRMRLKLDDMDEAAAIEKICKEVDFNCIGDLCMGKGLVGFYAYKYGKRFVGTELNKNRLAVLIEKIDIDSNNPNSNRYGIFNKTDKILEMLSKWKMSVNDIAVELNMKRTKELAKYLDDLRKLKKIYICKWINGEPIYKKGKLKDAPNPDAIKPEPIKPEPEPDALNLMITAIKNKGKL